MTNSWPEQDAVDNWFRAHSLELKQAVSAFRIDQISRLTSERDALVERLKTLEAVAEAAKAVQDARIRGHRDSGAENALFDCLAALDQQGRDRITPITRDAYLPGIVEKEGKP